MKQNGDLPRTVPPVRFIISKQQANNQWKQTMHIIPEKRVTATHPICVALTILKQNQQQYI